MNKIFSVRKYSEKENSGLIIGQAVVSHPFPPNKSTDPLIPLNLSVSFA